MSDQWFYAERGRREGPFTPEQLAERAAAGEVQAATLVWKQGMSGWKPAGTVSELASLRFSPAQAKTTRSGAGRHRWAILWALVGGISLPAINTVIFINKGQRPGTSIGIIYLIALGIFQFLVGAGWGQIFYRMYLSRRSEGPGVRKCPYCASWIKDKASACKFCQKEMPPAAPVTVWERFWPGYFPE